jgi:NADPH:quinone reductase-like Zn-dependent oxidoreductase
MRQIWITRAGPPEVLEVREAADPQAGPGQVRIRAKACGINFADLMARMGVYPDAPPIPCVVGYEVAGVVDQVGAGVIGWTEGDRAIGMPYFGGYSDTVVLPAQQAFPLPAALGFEAAAALPVVYLTAHHMLRRVANLRPGSRVLIHSAAGGIGLAVLQLARDCEVFGTASPSKHAWLKQQGLRHALDSGGDVPAQVREILGPDGRLDLVLDPVGGRSWSEGYRLLGPGGHLIAFGFSGAVGGTGRSLLRLLRRFLEVPRFSPMALMSANRTVSGVNLAHLFDRMDLLGPQMTELLRLWQAGAIAPHVDRAFPFEQAAAAHHTLHDRKAKGKIVLVP